MLSFGVCIVQLKRIMVREQGRGMALSHCPYTGLQRKVQTKLSYNADTGNEAS